MQLTTESKIRSGFGAALVLLLFSGATAYWTAMRSTQTFQAVEQAEQRLDLLRGTLSAVLDVETGARGFALSGNREFLEPFESGRARLPDLVRQLRATATGDPEREKRFQTLDALVQERVAVAVAFIQLQESRETASAADDAALAHGKTVMDSIRRTIGELEADERKFLKQASANTQLTLHRTAVVVAVSTALGLAVVALASGMTVRDLQKRRRAEEERDRFFTLSRDLLCFADFDGHFSHLNPAWETTLGYSREELLRRPFIEFVHPEDRARTIAAADRITKGEEVISFENRYRTRGGSYRWLSWNARGSLPNRVIYATARDITEQKQADDEIARLNTDLQSRAAQLEEANNELEAFSYSVSHDLRAPLRHIDGFVGLLKKGHADALDEKGRRYLNTIAESAKQMGTLIDDLLVFSRMGRTELKQVEVNLEDLARQVIASFQSETEQRDIKWTNGNLPLVVGDPTTLRQALQNLISNAVKYTRTRERAEIQIGSVQKPDEFVIFVRDNGVGFDMEYAHKLFGVFQRLHSSAEFEGTGIGLANVRRIIGRHGGRTWADGKVDAGATFYFSLPKKGTTPT